MSNYTKPIYPNRPDIPTLPGFQVKEKGSFKSAGAFEPFSRVVVTVSEEVEYTAGDETGRTLYVECPWGTQTIANDILYRIKGYTYVPYTSKEAILNPRAAVGDTVTFLRPDSNSRLITSSICSMEVNYGSIFKADISAPAEEEIDHEYPYVPKSERIINRKMEKLSSEFKVQAGGISAKVSKTGGDNESFGWELDEKSWTLKSKGVDVLKAYEGGVEITGKIVATSGKIGGFDILQDYLSYNGQTWGGTNSTGIYVGTQGIQCGPADHGVQITNTGYLYAEYGEFRGTVRAGKIMFDDPEKGMTGYGTLSGSAISKDSIPKASLVVGVRTSLGYADFANEVFSGYKYCDHLGAKKMHLGDYDMGWTTIKYLDHGGNARSARVITGQ